MPTNEWFQENPKISAYISKDLHQRLEEWMTANGIKKTSQALTQILENQLGVNQTLVQSGLNIENLYLKRLEEVEGKSLASLSW